MLTFACALAALVGLLVAWRLRRRRRALDLSDLTDSRLLKNDALLAALLAKYRPDTDSGEGKDSSPAPTGPARGGLNVDVKLWLIPFKDLQFEAQIGEGSFGRASTALSSLLALQLMPLQTPVHCARMPC